MVSDWAKLASRYVSLYDVIFAVCLSFTPILLFLLKIC